jgi:tetratricopeptide (TPR) repeat protein
VLGAFLLGSGSMQIFFGYPENYAPLFPLALVFALAGERDARSDGLPWRSALVLSVLLPMHFFTLSLAPAVLVLGLRSRRPRVFAPLALGIALAIAVLWLVAIRFPLSATIGQSDIAKSLPWFGAPDRSQAYRMLDFAHARDLLNLALLVAPGALLSLAFWRRRTFETLDGFFAAAALFPITAVCVANPTIGAFRDWDVLSWGLLPLGWFVARNAHAAGALILGTAGIWHAAVWVALNADPARSEVRFERLLESCPVSTRGASYGWEDVARRHVDAGRYAEAAQATLRATEAAPGNARLWLNAGELMRVSGDPERARECLERSRAILPEWAEPTHLLALLYAESGQWDPAITEFRHTLELDPFAHEARYELGLAYLRNAQPDSAREAFLRFREEFPNSAAVHLQLGEVERVVGDTATARVNYERVVALDPTGEIGQRARGRLGIAPPQDRASPGR